MSEERTRFDAWVTKWALTQGIYKTKVEDCFDTAANMVRQWSSPAYLHGKEWHLSRENAVKRAEEMREKKLRSLEEQIVKINGLDFEAMVKD